MQQYHPCSSLRENDFEHRCLCLAKPDFLVRVKIKTSSCTQGLLKVFHLEVLFNKKFYFEIIVDSHAVGGNIQRDLMCLQLISPAAASYVTLEWYCNQESDMDTVHWPFSDFTSFTCTRLCVCMGVCVHFYAILGICRFR